jgi:hypothetical protein
MPAKRTRINARGGKRYVRRNKKGKFDEVESVGRSHAQDQKRKSSTRAKRGQGDRGDRK